MPIEIRNDPAGDIAIVRLGNDPQFTVDLEALANQALAKPPAVVLEFSGVRYINSSNLSKLLRLRKRLIVENGKLVLCGMSPQVASVFQVTGLDKVFLFAGDVDGAVGVARR
jgi:anti-anti-sigma factor